MSLDETLIADSGDVTQNGDYVWFPIWSPAEEHFQ